MTSSLELNVVYPLTVNLSDQIFLRYLAIRSHPYEACGTVHNDGRICEYDNTFDGDQRTGFDMEIDIHDTSIKALWHSHPKGLEKPSVDDIPCIKLLAEHGFNFHHIIVTSKAVYEFEAVLVDDRASA